MPLVIDESPDRPDLSVRSEWKLPFPSADVASLRRGLQCIAKPVHHGAAPASLVRSIYFDDVRLAACRANLDGLAVREKVRLRWYDAPMPRRDCYLEIKWRRGQRTGKHRFLVASGAPLVHGRLQRLPDRLAPFLPQQHALLLQRAEQPVALVEYRREHFVRDDVRYTLDYDLRFHPLLDRGRITNRFVERLSGFALIECKAPIGRRDALRALGHLRSRPARFSKYVAACQRLGYLADRLQP